MKYNTTEDKHLKGSETLTRLMALAEEKQKKSLSDADYQKLIDALSSETDTTNEILSLLEGVTHLNLREKLIESFRNPPLLKRKIDRLSHVFQKNNSVIILDLSNNKFCFRGAFPDILLSLKNFMNVLQQDSCSIQALILSDCGLDDISVFS